MGFAGLAIMLAGMFTDYPPAIAFGIVLVLIHVDRLRQKDKEEQS